MSIHHVTEACCDNPDCGWYDRCDVTELEWPDDEIQPDGSDYRSVECRDNPTEANVR